MRVTAALAGIVAALTIAAPTASASPLFGVADGSFYDPAAGHVADREVEVGAETVRVMVSWNLVQPSNASSFNWATTDAYVSALASRNIRPLLLVVNAPGWAQNYLECLGNVACPMSNGHLGDWKVFVAAVVRRYSGLDPTGGVDADPIGVEVWNEENLTTNWHSTSGPNPSRYKGILQYAYQGSKSVDSSLPVITGGMTRSAGASGGQYSIQAFLTGMYSAGAKPYFDAIGIHSYPMTTGGSPVAPNLAEAEAVVTDAQGVRDLNGDNNKQLWVTETSYGSSEVPAAQIGTDILAEYDDYAAKYPDIAAFYVWRAVGTQYGLLNDDATFTRRQSFCDLKARFNPGTCTVGT